MGTGSGWVDPGQFYWIEGLFRFVFSAPPPFKACGLCTWPRQVGAELWSTVEEVGMCSGH